MSKTPNLIIIPKLKLKEDNINNDELNIKVSSMRSLNNLMNILCKEYSISKKLSPQYVNKNTNKPKVIIHKSNSNLKAIKYCNLRPEYTNSIQNTYTNPNVNANDYLINAKLSSLMTHVETNIPSPANKKYENNRRNIEFKKKIIKNMLQPNSANSSMRNINLFKNNKTGLIPKGNNSNKPIRNDVSIKKSISQMMINEINQMIKQCEHETKNNNNNSDNNYYSTNTKRFQISSYLNTFNNK